MARVVTAGELLDGHTVLDIECLDRIYLNAYVPIRRAARGRHRELRAAPTRGATLASASPNAMGPADALAGPGDARGLAREARGHRDLSSGRRSSGTARSQPGPFERMIVICSLRAQRPTATPTPAAAGHQARTVRRAMPGL